MLCDVLAVGKRGAARALHSLPSQDPPLLVGGGSSHGALSYPAFVICVAAIIPEKVDLEMSPKLKTSQHFDT